MRAAYVLAPKALFNLSLGRRPKIEIATTDQALKARFNRRPLANKCFEVNRAFSALDFLFHFKSWADAPKLRLSSPLWRSHQHSHRASAIAVGDAT